MMQTITIKLDYCKTIVFRPEIKVGKIKTVTCRAQHTTLYGRSPPGDYSCKQLQSWPIDLGTVDIFVKVSCETKKIADSVRSEKNIRNLFPPPPLNNVEVDKLNKIFETCLSPGHPTLFRGEGGNELFCFDVKK